MVSELKTESAVMRTSSPLQRMIQQLTPPSSPPQSLTILEDFLPSLAKTNLDKKMFIVAELEPSGAGLFWLEPNFPFCLQL